MLYSYYSDRAEKRLFTTAVNRGQAQFQLIKKFKKEYPNIYVHVNLNEIRLEDDKRKNSSL